MADVHLYGDNHFCDVWSIIISIDLIKNWCSYYSVSCCLVSSDTDTWITNFGIQFNNYWLSIIDGKTKVGEIKK